MSVFHCEELVYIDQSANDLKLLVTEGELQLDQFQVLCSDSIKREHVTFDMGIIGASHYMRIKTADGQLNEIMACVDVEYEQLLNTAPLQFSQDIIEADQESMKIRYRCSPKIYRWEEGTQAMSFVAALVAEVENSAGQIGLIHEFPGSSTDRPAQTIVWGELVNENEIHARTIHSYPNEELIAESYSVIQIDLSRGVN